MYVTDSERLFAEYLDGRELAYEYEPTRSDDEPGGNPDFLVHAPGGDVFCEITELSWFAAPEQLDGVSVHTGIDSYKHIRRKLQEKHQQGKHLKGKMPYVVVLYFDPPHPAVDFVVPGAMYGDVAISIPVDATGGPPPDLPDKTIFTSGGRLQKRRLTTISAVGVLSKVNPSVIEVENRIEARIAAEDEFDNIPRIVVEEYARPDYDRDAYETRLYTFHNMFAAEPRLKRATFSGPRDREFDVEGPVYTEVFHGLDP